MAKNKKKKLQNEAVYSHLKVMQDCSQTHDQEKFTLQSRQADTTLELD